MAEDTKDNKIDMIVNSGYIEDITKQCQLITNYFEAGYIDVKFTVKQLRKLDTRVRKALAMYEYARGLEDALKTFK